MVSSEAYLAELTAMPSEAYGAYHPLPVELNKPANPARDFQIPRTSSMHRATSPELCPEVSLGRLGEAPCHPRKPSSAPQRPTP